MSSAFLPRCRALQVESILQEDLEAHQIDRNKSTTGAGTEALVFSGHASYEPGVKILGSLSYAFGLLFEFTEMNSSEFKHV